MTSRMLDAIQEATDDAPDLADRIENAQVPDELLDDVPERWAMSQPSEVPDFDDGYHPYIPDPLRSRALAVPGTHVIFDFVTEDETKQDVAALMKHLLYANSVALSDPIPQIFDTRYFDIGEPHEDVLHYRRTRLANLVRFLYQVDSLIEDDALVFIEAPHYDITYKSQDLVDLGSRSEIRDAVAMLDPAARAFAAEAAERMMDVAPGTMPFGPESYAMHALNGILAQLETCTSEYGGWDLYLPQPAMQSVLAYIVKRATKAPPKPRRSGNRHDPKFLRELLRVELPNITERISIQDLVNIRSNDDAIDEWRRNLRAALRALNDEVTDRADLRPDVLCQIVREELRPAADHAAAQVGRSKVLSELRGEAITFVIGAVVEMSVHPPETLIGGAATLTTATCASLVYRWLNGRKTAPGRKALARHYAVFGP